MATDVSTLALAVDSSQVPPAVTRLDALTAASQRVEKAVSGTSGKVLDAGDRFRKLGQAIAAMDGPLGGVASRFRSFGSLIEGIGFRTAALAIAIGAIILAFRRLSVSVAGMADTWSDLNSRIGLAIGDMDGSAAVMDRLEKVARRTYSSFETTAESFIRNSTVLKELGKTTSQQLDFTEALNNALVVSGAKGERAAMIQEALGRAMAGGALRGQELNTVIQTGGRVAEVLAEELGIGTNQLRRLGAEGKITSEVIYNGLVKRMELLGEQADKMPATIGDGFTLIRNSLLQLVGVYDQANGLSEGFAKALVSVADNLKTVAKLALLAAAALVTMFSTAIMGAVADLTVAIGSGLVRAVLLLNAAVRANPFVFLAGLIATAITALVEFGAETYKIGQTTINSGKIVPAVFTTIAQSIMIAYDAATGLFTTLKNIITFNWGAIVGDAEAIGKSIADRIERIKSALREVTNPWQTTTTKPEQAPKASTALNDDALKAEKTFKERLLESQQAVELARQDLALQNASALVQDKARGAMELRQQMEQEALKLYGDRDAYDRKHYLQLLAEKDQLAEINDQIRKTQLINDIKFSQDQMGRSPIEQAVYERLNSAGLLDHGKIVDEATASLVRLDEQLKQSFDVQKDFASSFLEGLRQGKSAVDALTDSLNRLLDKLLDSQFDVLFSSLQKGGFLPNLFSGFGIGRDASGWAAGTTVTASAKGNVFDGGNVIPFARGGVVTRPTVFPMANGSGLMGEAGPEAIMPLRRGANGKLGVSGGGSKVEINVINNSGAEVTQQRRKTSDGEVIDLVIGAVKSGIGSGKLDNAMSGRYGARVAPRQR